MLNDYDIRCCWLRKSCFNDIQNNICCFNNSRVIKGYSQVKFSLQSTNVSLCSSKALSKSSISCKVLAVSKLIK